MDTHDFNEIYEIGGPSMRNSIDMIIARKKADVRSFENADVSNDRNIQLCIDYLLLSNDNEFKLLYLSIPDRLSLYSMADVNVKKECGYTCCEIAEACISDIQLINRGKIISLIKLNKAIKLLSNYNRNAGKLLSIDICKLLRESGCDMSYLYDIIHNYDILKYVINDLNTIEIEQILNNDEYVELSTILLFDKIYAMSDEGLKILTKNAIFSVEGQSMCLTVLQCYIIIKYMTIDEGKALMITHNENFDLLIKKHSEQSTNILLFQTLFNDILKFHFKVPNAF
jgi:hypothetical protein